MRIQDLTGPLLDKLEALPYGLYLGSMWAICQELHFIYSPIVDEHCVTLMSSVIGELGDAYEAVSRSGEAVSRSGLVSDWSELAASEEGPVGVLNLRMVFQDIAGELSGDCSQYCALDRVVEP